MAEHYTANTESVTRWCNQCNRPTQHGVSGGRIGRCLEHDAPQFSKKQLSRRERHGDQELRGDKEVRVRQGEGLGRNITTQLSKVRVPEDFVAPCGDPRCAGCYELVEILADGMEVHPRIHPPRSDY